MTFFPLSFFNRSIIGLTLVAFIFSISIFGCSSKPAEEEVKVTKRMKIVYPKEKPPVKKKVVKKKVVKKKPVKTSKPDVKWVNPKKATIKRKAKPKPAPAPAKKAPAPAPTKVTTAPVKKTTSTTTAPKALSGTNYVVSVSSFKDRSRAAVLANKLRTDGYNAYVTETVAKGTTWYRVRCGFFEGYSEAVKVKDELAKRYFAKGAWVDKPTKAEVAEFAK